MLLGSFHFSTMSKTRYGFRGNGGAFCTPQTIAGRSSDIRIGSEIGLRTATLPRLIIFNLGT
jgi:hypothetical protein